MGFGDPTSGLLPSLSLRVAPVSFLYEDDPGQRLARPRPDRAEDVRGQTAPPPDTPLRMERTCAFHLLPVP